MILSNYYTDLDSEAYIYKTYKLLIPGSPMKVSQLSGGLNCVEYIPSKNHTFIESIGDDEKLMIYADGDFRILDED